MFEGYAGAKPPGKDGVPVAFGFGYVIFLLVLKLLYDYYYYIILFALVLDLLRHPLGVQPAEMERIKKAGGVVFMKRVNGDLAVSEPTTHAWIFTSHVHGCTITYAHAARAYSYS